MRNPFFVWVARERDLDRLADKIAERLRERHVSGPGRYKLTIAVDTAQAEDALMQLKQRIGEVAASMPELASTPEDEA